jgi:hypothetical protein
MRTIDILREDYARFPWEQTYSLYAPDVYFKDPLNEFRGIDRYQKMIAFIQTWFQNCQMEVHRLEQQDHQIRTEWTLSWNTPLPWKPRIVIRGWSELTLNSDDLITAHIDYWHCSILDVLKQHWPRKS